jgi:hypothetical protein
VATVCFRNMSTLVNVVGALSGNFSMFLCLFFFILLLSVHKDPFSILAVPLVDSLWSVRVNPNSTYPRYALLGLADTPRSNCLVSFCQISCLTYSNVILVFQELLSGCISCTQTARRLLQSTSGSYLQAGMYHQVVSCINYQN